jgi:hypothetical protein
VQTASNSTPPLHTPQHSQQTPRRLIPTTEPASQRPPVDSAIKQTTTLPNSAGANPSSPAPRSETEHPHPGRNLPKPHHQNAIAEPDKIPSSKIFLPHSQILLWHKRIGHVNFQSLYHITSRNLVVSTPKTPLIKYICSFCMIGKMPRDRIPKFRSTFTTRPLQLIHSDICGPLPVTSRTGNRYILTFINDYTRKTWLYFLATKSQTLDYFKQFRALVETSTTQKIETLRSDREGKYTSQLFLDYYSSHRIHKQLTVG